MTLRLGVLGAARITPAAVLKPAHLVDGVEVVAVAARDRAKASAFAERHGISTVHGSYADLIADPEIDAIYNPLPNGLHGRTTLEALDAGKHVLCEKPLTANAEEAALVAERARGVAPVVFEAFHYRYHPLMVRVEEILRSGELGQIREVNTSMCVPVPMGKDIRGDLSLAGGAAMDIGCYAVNLWRVLAGAEPTVQSARATLLRPGIDRAMVASLATATGVIGSVTCSLWSWRLLAASATVVGTTGRLRIINPLQPQVFHRLQVRSAAGRRAETFGRSATYTHQLTAFRDACVDGKPFPTTADDAVATMEVLDQMYEGSGLGRRMPTPA